MKKIALIAMAALVALVLAACSSSSGSAKSGGSVSKADTVDGGLVVEVLSVDRVEDQFFDNLWKVRVKYENKGKKEASYNLLDWKVEDANGAVQSVAVYGGGDDLGSGSLRPGGTKEGDVYFKGDFVKIHYYGNMFTNDEPQKTWDVTQ